MTTRSLTARRARESSTKIRTSLDTTTNSILKGYKTVNECISFNISELACVLLICLGQRQPENRFEKNLTEMVGNGKENGKITFLTPNQTLPIPRLYLENRRVDGGSISSSVLLAIISYSLESPCPPVRWSRKKPHP